MIQLIVDKIPRIIKSKKKLEGILNVNITNKGKEVSISGEPEDEYIAEKVIIALDFGFSFPVAILIKDDNYHFEALSIKSYTKKHDLKTVRARIIGKEGKTLKTLSHLTECFFELKNNEVGIIGESEYIKNAREAIISIIRGAKQANVYAYLEKHHVLPIEDLGLKEENEKGIVSANRT